MTENELEAFTEDFSLLIELGFVAVKQMDEIAARRIFEAAKTLRPESTAPDIGLGYIALNKLEVEEAENTFQKVVDKEPHNYLAQTFLGITLLLSKEKRAEGEKLIADAMEKTDDPTIKSLGDISLIWAEKDLKKLKSPFFQQK